MKDKKPPFFDNLIFDGRPYYDLKTLSSMIGIKFAARSACRWIQEEQFPAHKVRGRGKWLANPDDVLRWFNERN
jgi:hypothetical protein